MILFWIQAADTSIAQQQSIKSFKLFAWLSQNLHSPKLRYFIMYYTALDDMGTTMPPIYTN